MLKHILRCIVAMLLLTGSVRAQDRQISGTVRDDQGQTMPGANIVIKGTTRGTTTDAVGEFRLSVPARNVTLTISSVGYVNQDITLTAGQSQVNATLQPDARQLQEVTITTALGIDRSAKTLSYSAQRVEGRQLTDVRDANFTNTLNGKVAGLVVTQGAGGPGAASRVVLRGNRSIQGSNNALFVVDGVPIDNSNGGQVGNDFGGYNGSDGASNINPDDIASISVLKGPAAAVLYGSRAANGVIMITTKKGKSGNINVNVNSGVAMESPMLLPKFQNEFVQGAGGVSDTNASGSWGAPGQTFPNNVASFFRTAYALNNSVSITGGSERTQTYLSYTNNYNQGIVPRNDLNRHTVNLRINSQVTKRLTTDLKITYVNQTINNRIKVGEESGVVMNVYKVPRSVNLDDYRDNLFDASGAPRYWTSSSIYMNPYWTVNKTSNSEIRNRVIALGSVRYEITPWLSLLGRVAYDQYGDQASFSFSDQTLLFARQGGSFQVANNNNIERNMDVVLSGNNNLGRNFKVNYDFGGIINNRSNVFNQTNADGLQVPNRFDLQFGSAYSVNTFRVKREIQSVFGRAQFSFRDYLLLDLTARNDWSSTLPAPHSYFYPSAGLTAIVSDMVRMPDWVSFAKVRASLAQVGNDAPPYLLRQTYSFEQGGTGGFLKRDATQALADLKPEITTALEFGLDWRFFNNRLGVDFTWYRTNSRNQLLTLGLAPASGFQNQLINAGNIQNQGFEISLTAKPLPAGKFNWDVTLNAARNVNTVVSLAPNIDIAFLGGGYGRTAGPVVATGGSYGDLYAFRWARNTSGQFIVDANGKPISTTSQEKVGNFNPLFSLGLNNSFTYGNFSFGALIDGKFGGVFTSGTDANLAFDGTADYTTANRAGGWVLPAVTLTGEANTKPINAETFWTTVSQGRYSWGEFFTYDATNVRLRELTAGYNFNLPSSLFIKSARLSFVARNLFFIYRGNAILDIPGVGPRKLQFDPDINLGAGNFQGVEYGNLPATRSMGLNLKLSF